MLTQRNDVFQETCVTMFCLNHDDEVRHWCEACEEADLVARTIESNYKKDLAKKESVIARQNAENERLPVEKDVQIARLKALLEHK